MFKTTKPYTSSFEFIRTVHKKGQTTPVDINFIHLELSRYIKMLFQLYRKVLNIFKCHIKFFFIWTATAQFKCNISC